MPMQQLKSKLIFIAGIYFLFASIVFGLPSPELVAEGAILIEANTGQVLYSKNGLSSFYPASTTKVLTSLILADRMTNPTTLITKTKASLQNVPSDSSHIGLLANDTYTYLDGLYAILMSSDNYVSYDMAIHTAGSMPAFAALMNSYAKEAGALHSHFVNAHGYHDENHYTTPYDLAKITRVAFQNPIVRQIASTPLYEFEVKSPARTISLKHTAAFFKEDSPYYNTNVVGAKTGFHTPAGRTLVAQATYDDIDLIAVVMKSNSPAFFEDINKLFDYGASNFKMVSSESTYGIENISYSTWSEPYITRAIDDGMLKPTLSSYMDPINKYDFEFLLSKRLGLPLSQTTHAQQSISPARIHENVSVSEAQMLFAQASALYGVSLPKQFVASSLSKVYATPPTLLTLEDSIYLQEHFQHYVLYNRLLTPTVLTTLFAV